jgi:hypothetical protein
MQEKEIYVYSGRLAHGFCPATIFLIAFLRNMTRCDLFMG